MFLMINCLYKIVFLQRLVVSKLYVTTFMLHWNRLLTAVNLMNKHDEYENKFLRSGDFVDDTQLDVIYWTSYI